MPTVEQGPQAATTLRPATAQDLPVLARLWRRAWHSANPWVALADVAPPAHWEARAHAEFGPPCLTWVAVQGQAIAAFLVLDPGRAYLHQLFVSPEAQGQGLGAALVRQIATLCPGGWTLHVATANSGARRFYARCGLREGLIDTHPATGRERVLCRWLPSA